MIYCRLPNAMVNSCCVPECKFSYKSSKKSEPVALFRFPQKDMQYQYWGKNELNHFTEDNFKTRSSDHRESHKQACLSQSLERICLKPTAVPHIFSLLPQYLSSNSSAPQPTTSSTSSAVLINENSQINKHVSYYLKEKNFSGVQRNVKIWIFTKRFCVCGKR